MNHSGMKSLCLTALLTILVTPLAWGANGQTSQSNQLKSTTYTLTVKTNKANLKALDAKLEAASAFKAAKCSAIGNDKLGANRLSYACANPGKEINSVFLKAAGKNTRLTENGCPSGCVVLYCPYPWLQCCNIITKRPCQ